MFTFEFPAEEAAADLTADLYRREQELRNLIRIQNDPAAPKDTIAKVTPEVIADLQTAILEKRNERDGILNTDDPVAQAEAEIKRQVEAERAAAQAKQNLIDRGEVEAKEVGLAIVATSEIADIKLDGGTDI